MITITNQPQLQIESAYNNQVFEFEADQNKTAVRAVARLFFNPTVTNNEFSSNKTLTFDIPANTGNFYFNARKGITNLFNKDNFSDGLIPSPTNFLRLDEKLFCNIGIEFEVVYNNNSRDFFRTEKKYFKSVRNFFNDKENSQPSDLRLLTATNFLNYFEGLPFDIPFYTPTAGPVTITNETNNISTTKTFQAGVNRLFISNGESYNLGFENEVPLLNDRINRIVFKNALAEELGTIFIKKNSLCPGPFVKWFNEFGAWNYWRFERAFQGNTSHQNKQFLNSDFDNFENQIGNFEATGKTASRQYQIYSKVLNENEVDYFKSIFISPKIFLYNQEPNEPLTASGFKEVSLVNGTNQDINTKIRNREFSISLELPSINTQSYEN